MPCADVCGRQSAVFKGSIKITDAQAQLVRKKSQADLPHLKSLIELLQTMLKTQIDQFGEELRDPCTALRGFASLSRP
jgi:hypothetical protein